MNPKHIHSLDDVIFGSLGLSLAKQIVTLFREVFVRTVNPPKGKSKALEGVRSSAAKQAAADPALAAIAAKCTELEEKMGRALESLSTAAKERVDAAMKVPLRFQMALYKHRHCACFILSSFFLCHSCRIATLRFTG